MKDIRICTLDAWNVRTLQATKVSKPQPWSFLNSTKKDTLYVSRTAYTKLYVGYCCISSRAFSIFVHSTDTCGADRDLPEGPATRGWEDSSRGCQNIGTGAAAWLPTPGCITRVQKVTVPESSLQGTDSVFLYVTFSSHWLEYVCFELSHLPTRQ